MAIKFHFAPELTYSVDEQTHIKQVFEEYVGENIKRLEEIGLFVEINSNNIKDVFKTMTVNTNPEFYDEAKRLLSVLVDETQ